MVSQTPSPTQDTIEHNPSEKPTWRFGDLSGSNPSIFSLILGAFCILFRKQDVSTLHALTKVVDIFLFSSRTFIVVAVTFRSMIHLKVTYTLLRQG